MEFSGLSSSYISVNFWHEKSSLHFVDNLETIQDPYGRERNLNLTYAVRDGIISHCGEVDEKQTFPRDDDVELNTIKEPNQFAPYTWEGCVVKVADKISYLGRDIEDAFTLKVLTYAKIKELKQIYKKVLRVNNDVREVNNTLLINSFINNLCTNSSPERGITFSNDYLELMSAIKEYNFKNIYNNERLNYFKEYAQLVIETIFNFLVSLYRDIDSLKTLSRYKDEFPLLYSTFSDWLIKYSTIDSKEKQHRKYYNHKVYILDEKSGYIEAVLDYISGMTDNFAIKIFNEIIRF